MASAISSGVAGRPAGAWAASCSTPSPMASVPSVRVGPGLTALTRTPRGPYSAAHALVSRLIAALLELYRLIPANPKSATMVDTLTIAPLPLFAISGASSATRKYGTFTFSECKVEDNLNYHHSIGANPNVFDYITLDPAYNLSNWNGSEWVSEPSTDPPNSSTGQFSEQEQSPSHWG